MDSGKKKQIIEVSFVGSLKADFIQKLCLLTCAASAPRKTNKIDRQIDE